MPADIGVEVAYALPQAQTVVALCVRAGTTVRQAVERSGLLQRFSELRLEDGAVGIFGQLRELGAVLSDGDRVELYRPLLLDPKERRRAAAKKR